MKILKYSLGQLQANCYLLIKDKTCLIIDPGDEGEFILEEIQRNNLKPVGILATHGHFDHVMAIGEIQASFDIPLYINEKDLFLLKRVKESAQYFLGIKPAILPIKNIKNLGIGHLLEIRNWKLEIISSPGHTPGSVCYYFSDEKVIFTGDTLFKEGIGRYDFSYSSKDDLDNSLKKLLELPQDSIIYPGHGDETTVAHERLTLSPFQRR